MNKYQSPLRSAMLIITVSFFVFSCSDGNQTAHAIAGENSVELEGTISISGAFALYPLTVKWAEEFKKIHPNVKFDISAGGAGKGISDVLGGLVDLGGVSRDIYSEEIGKGAVPFVV